MMWNEFGKWIDSLKKQQKIFLAAIAVMVVLGAIAYLVD